MPKSKKELDYFEEESVEVEDVGKQEDEIDAGAHPLYGFSEEYSLDGQAEIIAKLLIQQFPDQLGYIDIEKIGFVRKDCKPTKSGKKKFVVCKAIKQPTKAFCSKTWIIVTWGNNYKILPLAIKQRVIFHELMHVPRFVEEGVNDHDVEDFAYCVDAWGSRWTMNFELPPLVDMEETVEDVNDTMPPEED